MGRIEDLGLVVDKGLEWKAKYEAAKEELLKCVQWQHELRQQRAVVANQNRIHLTYLLECHRKGGITPLFLALEEYVQKLQGEAK